MCVTDLWAHIRLCIPILSLKLGVTQVLDLIKLMGYMLAAPICYDNLS